MNELIEKTEVHGVKVYLDEPISIKGIRIGHTKEGLKFLIEHYTNMTTRYASKYAAKDLEHARLMITNYKQHLELYTSQDEERQK